MKKSVLAILLCIALVSAVHAVDSVSTVIEGIVHEMLSITTDMGASTTIDVFNSSTAFLGYINVFSNREGKWTITVSSTNAGIMRGSNAGNNDIYPYSLTFGSTRNIDLSTPFVLELSGKTSTEGSAFALGIDFENFWNLANPVAPDTYRDTITITIAAA